MVGVCFCLHTKINVMLLVLLELYANIHTHMCALYCVSEILLIERTIFNFHIVYSVCECVKITLTIEIIKILFIDITRRRWWKKTCSHSHSHHQLPWNLNCFVAHVHIHISKWNVFGFWFAYIGAKSVHSRFLFKCCIVSWSSNLRYY